MIRLKDLWTFIYQALHPFSNIIDHRPYLLLFYYIQQIQLIDMTNLQDLVQNKELASIVTIFRIFSVYSSFDQTLKIIFQFFLFSLTFLIVFVYIWNPSKVPFEIKIILLFWIMIFRIPSKVLGLELLLDFVHIQYAIIGCINFLFACLLHAIWVYFGRANSVKLDSPYNHLYYSFNVPLLAIVLNGFHLQFYSFITIIAYFILEITQQLYFTSPVNKGEVLILSVVLPSYICFYYESSITSLLLFCTLSFNLLLTVYQIVLNQILTQENQNVIQMIQIIYDGILNQDILKLSIIMRNHRCSKCKNIDEIIDCIYKQIARNYKDSKDLQQIILLNAYHFALEKPIQSIIHLLRQYDRCDLYHKIAYQQAILKCHEYIEERCQITIKSPNRSLNDSNEQAKRCLQLADKILNQQQYIWTQFSKGLQTIDQYVHLITKMYKQISHYDEIMRKIEEDKSRDIQQLKLLQLYYGLIQYNPKQVSIIEQQIQDQMKIDRYKIEVTLNSLVIYENRYIMLRMSMINDRGQLINPNLRLLKQFLECEQEISNVSILDLMPKAIANVHDNFIDNYIYRGYSSLTQSQTTIHFQRQNGFILSAQLSVDHIQNLTEDFIITSLAIKPHSNPQLILFSQNGQIIGMDESVFQIINSFSDNNIQIEEIINHGALIHIFIKNIAQSLQLLLRDYNNTGQTIIYDINDFWNVPKNYKQLIRQSNEIVQQTNENLEYDSIPLFNQKYNQQLENLSIQQSQNRNQVHYHLSFLTYKHNKGQFVMFQLQVNDHNQELEATKNSDDLNQPHKSLLIQSNKLSSSNESIQDDDVMIASPMESNEFRFMNQLTNRQLISVENAQEAEIQQFMEKSNNGLTDHLAQASQLSPKKLKGQKNNKQKNLESIHSQSVSSSKEDDHILRKISQDKSIIKPLLYASVILFFILLSLEIFILLNINLISSNINDQTEQIKVLMEPQNINYAYSSIITKMMFQFMKDSNIITMSDFMYNYNKESIQRAYKYCQEYIPPLCVTLPLYQAKYRQTTFNQSFVELGQLTSSIEPIEQINFKMLSSMLSLINDTNYDLISSRGYIRQNIEAFSIDLDTLIVNLRNQAQADQLKLKDNLAFYSFIQLLVVVILFVILYIYIHRLDQITSDMITVSCRINMYQAQEQIFKIQQAQKALTFNFINKNIWDNLFEGFQLQIDTKDVEQSRLLYSKLPSKKYYDKSNIFIILIQFIAYLAFFSIGLGIYFQQVDIFLPGGASTLNLIRFKHNFDTVLLFGALIKMDSWVLDNNLTYLNQSRIITKFNDYNSHLSFQLNNFVENIYSSTLQNDKQFSDLLFEDLCNTYNLTCCYIRPGNVNYSQYDDFSNLISQGIVGYTEEIHKYINQDFYNEIQSLEYQHTSIDNQYFQNIFLSYFTEVQDIMQKFLLLFIEQNQKMAEQIIQITQIYYLVVGNLYLYFIKIFYKASPIFDYNFNNLDQSKIKQNSSTKLNDRDNPNFNKLGLKLKIINIENIQKTILIYYNDNQNNIQITKIQEKNFF